MQRIFSKFIFLTECILTVERLVPRHGIRLRTLLANQYASRYLAWLAVILLSLASLAFISIGSTNALSPTGSHDLQWTPARDLLAGVNPYEHFLQWKHDGHALTPPHFLNQSPSYPASVYMMLAPLGMLDWQSAKVAWLAINLMLIVLLLGGLQRQFPIRRPVVLAIVLTGFLCSTPLRASLGAGQMNLLSLAAFVWAYDFSRRAGKVNQGLAGALLAVAWAKYSLTFPLTLLFINQKNWRPVAIAAAIHAALTLAAAHQMNLLPHEFFFSSVAVVLMGSGTGFANMSALAITLHLPTPIAMAAISTAFLSTAYVVSRMRDIQPLALMSLLALVSYALFYHHNYDFIVLIFLAWCVATEKLSPRATAASLLLIFLSWCGLWLTGELQTTVATTPDLLVTAVESLQVVVFYSALVLLSANLRRSKSPHKAPDGVLAF